jgi:hypothetical protein
MTHLNFKFILFQFGLDLKNFYHVFDKFVDVCSRGAELKFVIGHETLIQKVIDLAQQKLGGKIDWLNHLDLIVSQIKASKN